MGITRRAQQDKHCQQKEVQIQRLDRLLDRLSGFGYKPDENNCILGLVK
jgi:hypothetical protein